MGVSKSSLTFAVVGCVFAWPGLSARAADNAISGTVVEAGKDGKALKDVTVTLDQNTKTNDTTDDRGRYALAVSSDYNPASLVFTKIKFTGIVAHVKNDKSPNKLDDVVMAKQGTLAALPKDQIEAIVKNTLQAAKLAESTKSPRLAALVHENLAMFKDELKDPPEAVRSSLHEIESAAMKLPGKSK